MLYKHLRQMQERPGIYNCEGVEDISKFIFGYSTAIFDNSISDNDCLHFEGFQDFVNNHYLYDNITSYSTYIIVLWHTRHGTACLNIFKNLAYTTDNQSFKSIF